jgi:hypothetical protein
MLPEFYRFRVYNGSGQTLTYADAARVEVHITPWKMTSGAMAQGTIISDTTSLLNTGETITATSSVEGDVHDNTTLLHIGFTGTFYVKADSSSTDGPITLWMEMSTDNSRWPSDMSDGLSSPPTELILLGTIDISEDEDKMVNIQF